MCVVYKCSYLVGHFDKSGGSIGYCWVIFILRYWFVIASFLDGKMMVIQYSFFLRIHLSRATLTPVTEKRETSVSILDYNNISFGYDGSNWLTIDDLLFIFCVLVYYLVVLSISRFGDIESSFAISVLSLGDTESFSDFLSSKSYLACYFSTSALGWKSSSSVIFALPIRTTNIWYVFIYWSSIFVWYFLK